MDQKTFELENAQADLDKKRAQLKSSIVLVREEEKRKEAQAIEVTSISTDEIATKRKERAHSIEMLSIQNLAVEEMEELKSEQEKERLSEELKLALQSIFNQVSDAELRRRKANDDQDILIITQKTEDYIKHLTLEAENEAKQAGAVQPQFIEALHALAQAESLGKMTENFAPLSVVQGIRVGEVLRKMFIGTGFERTINNLLTNAQAKITAPMKELIEIEQLIRNPQ